MPQVEGAKRVPFALGGGDRRRLGGWDIGVRFTE